jgi:GGDEF domain-containing protein
MMPEFIEDGGRCSAFIALTDEVARAASISAVYAALSRYGAALVGAAVAAVVERVPARTGEFHGFVPVRGPGGSAAAPFQLIWPMTSAGTACRHDEGGQPGAHLPLLAAFAPLNPHSVVYVPTGDAAVLLLAFPDAEPQFAASDWRMLESAVRQAAAAMERVEALERVRELSLTDPATGLGNRRLLEIVLEHSFAQAQRGEPLTVVSILPVRAGAAGAPSYDFAELLRRQVRGADVVARVENDVFVVVLHAASAEGAGVFLRRVVEAAGSADFRCALAQHDELFDDSTALLETVLSRLGASPTAN